ncbi:TIGR03826 family flagellar region protein [Geosporobacter ferrireducens]|uniref:MerR family transcriptional regulator n=1 Tax=Geosporobacter ferrireducens TaxID=1424294 RepID=A0A1D8GGI5_9FIRM|nr:TIGR03826 family flagellar region protein [Geosporobacter ferrireducens]AOT70032.1 MerR family transcriptional regulator [Geosporobacter ferrireducens]MTI53422.1 MerR family transcriptional regulator [Geosporobacter ferrireducens]
MADIRNCRKCGRIFQYDGFNKNCERCRKNEEEDFRRVKEYLYDNPGATISEVSQETEVEEDLILKYLRQGRLEITGEGGSLVLDCERCGRAIRTGRFCDQCAEEMAKEMRGAFKPPEKEKQKVVNKMFITDMKKKR